MEDDAPEEASLARERARDQDSTAFTPALRKCFGTVPGAIAAAFFDAEGESVDYCSAVDPYDAKVIGASLRVLLEDLQRTALGRVHGVTWVCDERTFVVRRVADGYDLVVAARTGRGVDARANEAVTLAVHELRIESGLGEPPTEDAIAVEVRRSRVWGYAPGAFIEAGQRRAVASVLGRWQEQDDGTEAGIVCFRVRTEQGEELTLAHDPARGAWERR